jgi:hypothetical protein
MTSTIKRSTTLLEQAVTDAPRGAPPVSAEGNRLVTSFSFGKVPGIATFVFQKYFAVAPNGTLYADNLGPRGFGP